MENLMEEYFSYDSRKDIESFSKVPTEAWMKLGEQKALETFQTAAKAVPAYRDFLKKNKVNPEKIKTYEDFKKIPLTTKNNYFNYYPIEDLSIGNDIKKSTVIHFSSGTSGKSLYWPKSPIQDLNTYKGVEMMYINYFDIDKKSTLLINCFAMGPWPAGEIVHTAAKLAAEKGLKLSVISPGTNISIFCSVFKDLAGKFDQIIIGGYPSFLKDLVDESLRRGIIFRKHNVKLLTGGEKFTENWRLHMARLLGNSKPYKLINSVLGSSETGMTSMSTPFTDYLRIYLNKHRQTLKKIRLNEDLPSITQYIPPARNIEIIGGNIVISCMGLVPLIRYDTKDYGKIFFPKEILGLLPKEFSESYAKLEKQSGVPNLPILTINGRSDKTIKIFGANIYPEQISYILDHSSLQRFITGRFIAETVETQELTPVLVLTLELKYGQNSSLDLKGKILSLVLETLPKLNLEFDNALTASGKKAHPKIILKDYKNKELQFQSGKGVLVKS